MSRINTSTLPSVTMNSIQILDPIIGTLINLITNTKHATDCKHVMAVALHQHGITTFDHLCEFPYSAEFHGRFSYYKQQDADVGTINGKDVFIVVGIKMYIQWLVLWCIHRKENKNDPKSNNPLEWTQDEFCHFKTGCRSYSITPTIGPTIRYDEYINNKNQSTVNDTNPVVDSDDMSSSLPVFDGEVRLSESAGQARAKKKYNDDVPSLGTDISNEKKKKIPSSLTDLSNIPASTKKKKIPSTSMKKTKKKIPSSS